jgi:LemA protein
MDSLVSAVVGLFMLVFWVVLIIGGISLFFFNKLRKLRETVRRRRAIVGAALPKKAQILSKVQEAVKGHQGFEQFTRLKISQDSAQASLAAAFAQTNSAMTAFMTAAHDSPQFQSSALYHELMADNRKVNEDIETRQLQLTEAIDDYNTQRGGIPCVLFAGFLGFRREEYPNFDTQGTETAVGVVGAIESHDEDRMEQLLQSAGTSLLGATRVLASQASTAGKAIANQAGQASKLIADRVAEKAREKGVVPSYFYMLPWGTPKGPASKDDLRVLLSQGMIQQDAIVAEVGSQDWQTLGAVSAAWEENPLQ